MLKAYFVRWKQAQQVWEDLQVEQHWQKNGEPRRRFLGSLQISQQHSEQLLDLVAHNLQSVEPLTFNHLDEKFSSNDPEKCWIKIVTLALAEYAYYDEGHAGFWQSICDRLSIENTQGTQKCFRDTLDVGFRILNIVRTQQANQYVSTLWLQSGIPQKNLEHFSSLIEDIFYQYDWWDIAHAEPEDLSILLYDTCQRRYPQWGKLLTFLSSSCSQDGEETAPISGELLQGIALVAQSLERKGLEPSVLKDVHTREHLLQQFCLPRTFFLRSWDNLIQVLTPQNRDFHHRRKIVSYRKKPLFLTLDIVDSMDIQLVLPEQAIWKADWKKFRDTYVQIKGCGWESTFPPEGPLEIEKQQQSIDRLEKEWTWRLKSHTRMALMEWQCEGVTSNLPMLIFDVWTGERVVLSSELLTHKSLQIKGHSEIFCFYDAAALLEYSDNVELIDGFAPCSLRGWRGQHLFLESQQATITFTLNKALTSIVWQEHKERDVPQLKGLKIKDRNAVYADMPSVWYPPLSVSKTINIQIEDLNNRTALTQVDEQLKLVSSDRWQSLPLSKWIQKPGCYTVQLWHGNERWSEKFELRSSVELAQLSSVPPIQLYEFGDVVQQPKQVTSTSAFWLSELMLKHLWPLESVRFLLTNGTETHTFDHQANSSGTLLLNLATLHDVLPDADQYSLHYYDKNNNKVCLLKVSAESQVVCGLSAQFIQLSGLPTAKYTLSLWNLLRPDEAPLTLPISIPADMEVFEFPLRSSLADTFGIFHIQLESAMHVPRSVGWWSGIESVSNLQIPENADEDSCYNVLGNEAVEEFEAMFRTMDFGIDCGRIERAIASLDRSTHYLPDWINRALLQEKLTTCLPKAMTPVILSEKKKALPPAPTSYHIEVRDKTKHKMFQKMFEKALKKKKINKQVNRIQDRLLYDLIRVELATTDVLPELKAAATQLGKQLGTTVVLKEWKR